MRSTGLQRRIGLLLAGLVIAGSVPRAAGDQTRTHGGYYTPERLANARHNTARFAWAREIRTAAVDRATPWRIRSDEELWALIAGQDLPRTINVTLTRGPNGTTQAGCLECGRAIERFGQYPYEPDFDRQPWKLKCPSCGSVFPKNDFGAYYRSGIDGRGLFCPARADRRLLFNAEHPDPADPLHRFGVDDGFGFVDASGRTHRYIAYYAWKYWRWIIDGLMALADAYVHTGEPVYAHKAAVLLDRIADVYPEMDWKPYADRGWYHSDGNRGVGKIEGAIWETNVARKLAEAYDATLSGTIDDAGLFAFLQERARRFRLPTQKGTRADFVRAIDERVLRTIHRAVLSGQIQGNEGMHQMTVASCAMALNTDPETGQWLDWLFAPDGGAIPGILLSQFDRDGASDEAAPTYAALAGQLFSRLASRLHGYALPGKHDLMADFPQLRATFGFAARLAVLGRAVPNLGDSGSTGLVSSAPANAQSCAEGFRITRDPSLATMAYRLNGNSAQGLARDIFASEPDALAGEIAHIAEAAGPRPVGGGLMTGFGLASLETGRSTADGFAIALNYGRTTRHGHADLLNFDLFAFGKWLAPDFGYPEFATDWPSRDEWTVNTLAHNTVSVDGHMQRRVWGGKVKLFAQRNGFGIVEIDGTAAYPELSAYTRTMALVATPGDAGAYAIDIFAVRGGRDHVWSFHGPSDRMTSYGLSLSPQRRGTYAGVEIPLAQSPGRFPAGYSYLHDVARDASPPPGFAIDWTVPPGYCGARADEDTHVQLHVANVVDEVALAMGDPPQNVAGNPRRLGFVLQHRAAKAGATLASTFVSVIEPYRGTPVVREVTRLPTSDGLVVLQVALATGHRDTFFWSERDAMPSHDAAGFSFRGRIAWLRAQADGRVTRAVTVAGSELILSGARLAGPAEIHGRVEAMNRELTGGGWIWLRPTAPFDTNVVGRIVRIANNNERDACYVIAGAEREGDRLKVHCGPISFVRGFAGPARELRGQRVPASYGAGYQFDFEPGAEFRIPLDAEWPAPEESAAPGN